jgi:hypothetical protein
VAHFVADYSVPLRLKRCRFHAYALASAVCCQNNICFVIHYFNKKDGLEGDENIRMGKERKWVTFEVKKQIIYSKISPEYSSVFSD